MFNTIKTTWNVQFKKLLFESKNFNIAALVLPLIGCISILLLTPQCFAFDDDYLPKAGDPCKSLGSDRDTIGARTYYLKTAKYKGKGKAGGLPCRECELDCHMRVRSPCPGGCELTANDARLFSSSTPPKGDKSKSGCYEKPPGGYCKIQNRKIRNEVNLKCVYTQKLIDNLSADDNEQEK